MEISSQYDPKQVESKWSAYWQENKLAGASAADADKVPFTVVIPPPNVTGILHMGHALNNTIQDILVRWKRLTGFNALWVPGTDHAGIATQNVVERKLKKEGTNRKELGREKFIEQVWDWRQEYGGTIIRQLKRLGASCDWDRERFTMDEGLSDAVQDVFIKLYDKGLVYHGDYIINWCPRCHTALSDEEAEHKDTQGNLYYIKYPIHKTQKHIVVATTRPETMFGDQAVAVNPKDERYRYLKGGLIELPLTGRTIPVIEDQFVDPEFGTGLVKVTPSHDPNDFEMGNRHNLDQMVVMDETGKMNENAPEKYQGMDRFECRKQTIKDLEELGLIEKIEPHQHAVRNCYRCSTVVEPRLSGQWFVKMKPLAEPAIEAVKNGTLKFHPERWTKVYLEWMENIRDWCISRQIWWGHRIPIYYCENCSHITVSKTTPQVCDKCSGEKFRQEEDVLDTWFSSWLWPFSVFGWPEQSDDLKYFYPTSDLSTAPDIIFFWVARMVMAGIEFMGEVPFKNVYIHGLVRDDTGRKMSKSIGNIIDPIEVIEECGADALRFSLIMITASGQDVYLSKDKFEIGRTFCNKIWNASRFLLLNMGDEDRAFDLGTIDQGLLDNDDRYILAMLDKTIASIDESLKSYRFNEAAKTIYDFFWHHFCDRYIESAKVNLYADDEALKSKTRKILGYVLGSSLKLLHPFMPFITEELWSLLHDGKNETALMRESWPEMISTSVDQDIIDMAQMKYDLVRLGRKLRKDYSIPAKAELKYYIKPGSEKAAKYLATESKFMLRPLKALSVDVDVDFEPSRPTPSDVCAGGTIFMEIDGVVDFAAERERFDAQLAEIDKALEAVKKKLSNQAFLQNARKEVVEKQKNRQEELWALKEKVLEGIKVVSPSE